MGFVYSSAEQYPVQAGSATLIVSFWRRASAVSIDTFLIGIATGIIDRLAESLPNSPYWALLIWLASAAVAPLYFIWAYSTTGQTPGKKLLHIKVVSIDGLPLNWRKGVLRVIGYVLSDCSFALGYLWSIWDPDKQAWQDKIAGTRVVPASATEEQVTTAYNQMSLRPRSNRWKWVAAGAVALQLAVAACVVVAPLMIPSSMPPQYHAEDWDRFEKALFDRVNPDSKIPNFSTNMEYSPSGKAQDIWLIVEAEYDADCEMGSENPSDWCYRLTNELVKIVFDNYPHIDEITGIHVSMTKVSEGGALAVKYSPVDDALTINEWRQRLGIPKP